ncbi:hypothetical protein, partial [Alistipes putredinis]|uniref:hypothetical protein n=2 Tax=Alistipes putredinis TaxID=28117 RepID=UPI003FEFFE9A
NLISCHRDIYCVAYMGASKSYQPFIAVIVPYSGSPVAGSHNHTDAKGTGVGVSDTYTKPVISCSCPAAELMKPAKAKNNKTNLFIAVECFLIKNKHFIGNQTNNFRIK